VTSSLVVFEALIRMKSTHMIKSCLKIRKKRENVEIKDIFLHKSSSKRLFLNGLKLDSRLAKTR